MIANPGDSAAAAESVRRWHDCLALIGSKAYAPYWGAAQLGRRDAPRSVHPGNVYR